MNASSLAWGTLDSQFPSKALDTFLHGVKPQVTRKE
jgi:hypothetical protein